MKEGKIGRPSVALPYAAHVEEIFRSEPRLPTAEVLRRVRLRGYTGRKTALYHLAAVLRFRQTGELC